MCQELTPKIHLSKIARVALLSVLVCILWFVMLRFILPPLFHLLLAKPLRSNEDVRLIYAQHIEQCEQLKAMCLEDKSNLPLFAISLRGREANCVQLTGSANRCQDYKRLLESLKALRVSWEEGCVWILVDGWGWAGSGVRKGLMWRESPIPPGSTQRYTPITNGWYVYEINPSKPLFSGG